MPIYVISDLHGDYEGYLTILEKIKFSGKDTLYVNGDVVDRGTGSVKILRHMMQFANIYPVLGNHEYMACRCLNVLIQEVTERNLHAFDKEFITGLTEWLSIGGQEMINEFHKLSSDEKLDILDYLGDFSLYEEVEVSGQSFIIVHAGLENFNPHKSLDEYELFELIFRNPDYEKVYFPDKYLVTGHLPTSAIVGNPNPHRIYRTNRHIAIDCGAGYDGQIGAICLDTGVEYYSKE